MTSTATTPEEYLASLPAERQAPMAAIRKILKKNLPKGFKEVMCYGMIGYVVPHSLYPAGYHCDPKQALPFMNLASQKNFISLYHMGLYGDSALMQWFTDAYAKTVTTKIDMGKGCVRFKKMDQIPLALIEELAKKVTVQEWINTYETMLKKR